MIPFWFKTGYSAFVLLIVIIWWRHYGWRNFLWLSDVALIGAVPAMWLEQSMIASTLTVMALVPEMMWNLDYLLRLVLRRRITGMTEYMFEAERPMVLKALSLFHVPLPAVMLWMVAAYGHEPTALPVAIVSALVVLALSRYFSSPQQNLNWTHRFGTRPSTLPAWLHLSLLIAGMILLFFIPTDWLLRQWFG